MEGDDGNALVFQDRQIVQSTPHIGYSFDFEGVGEIIARTVHGAEFAVQMALFYKRGASVVGQEGHIEGCDGSGARAGHKDGGGVDAVLLGMRHQIPDGRMGILNGHVPATLYGSLSELEPQPVVDGGSNIACFGKMLTP